MYLIIIVLPFISFIINCTMGRKIGKQGAILVSNIAMIISAIITYIGAYEIIIGESMIKIKSKRWVMGIDWAIQYDNLTILMSIIILSIATSVFLYTSAYMSTDPHVQRFYGYLSLFIFFMLVVVTSNNYLVLFLGWEGIKYALNGF